MSQAIKVRFSNFLSEIEQMEEDNKKLNEDISVLEKEKADGYSKFDTETHVLVERKTLKGISDSLDDAYGGCEESYEDSCRAVSDAEDAQNNVGYARDDVYKAQKQVDELLLVEKEEDTE